MFIIVSLGICKQFFGFALHSSSTVLNNVKTKIVKLSREIVVDNSSEEENDSYILSNLNRFKRQFPTRKQWGYFLENKKAA